jgi:hypothetical protein
VYHSDRAGEFPDLVLHDVPQDLGIDPEVGMNENIAEPAILRQSTSGWRFFHETGSRFTVSPMTRRLRARASTEFSSPENSS